MSSPTAEQEKSTTTTKTNNGEEEEEEEYQPDNLHDCVALGEIEYGLSQNDTNRPAMEEIERLPLFLRVLALTRPQSSIVSPVVVGGGAGEKIIEAEPESQQRNQQGEDVDRDALVNEVVEHLEDVVAKHSVAEGVDVMTCHLAPSVTRKLSKLPPLKRSAQNGKWKTKELAAVARNPRSSNSGGSKRKRKVEGGEDGGGESKKGTSNGDDGGIHESSDDEEMEDVDPNSVSNKKLKKGQSRRDSLEVAAEDSQEATVTKTLSELASLVVTSLIPINNNNDPTADADDNAGGGGKETGLSLTIDDSILSESAVDTGAAESGGGAMEGSDLASTVSAIMHHAPVLRSRQVASALCRASIPQGGNLVRRMGANCPASVPSLLLGCIQAYSAAIDQGNASISKTAKQSVTALAKLSRRECSRVLTKLQASNIMMDVQLKLAAETDPTTAACILVNNLNTMDNFTSFESDRMSNVDDTETGTQPPGDNSSDFHALEEIDDNLASATPSKEPTLLQLLSNDAALCQDTFEFLSKEISKIGESIAKSATGHLCLFLRALGLLLLVPGKVKSKFDSRHYVAESVLQLMNDVATTIKKLIPVPMEVPDSSMYDNLVNLVRCCMLLAIANVLSEQEVPSAVSEKCSNLMELSRNLPCVSRCSSGFAYCLDFAMNRKNALGLFTQTVNVISGTKGQTTGKFLSLFVALELGLKKSCDLPGTVAASGVCYEDIDMDFVLSALRSEIPESYEKADDALDAQIKSALTRVLDFNAVLQGETIPRFVVEATDFLHAREKLHVPVVLSAELTKSASRLNFLGGKKERPLNGCQSRFLLQLLHALEFLDLSPRSPFLSDPRSLPMKEALAIIARADYTDMCPFLEKRLRKLVWKHCPEVIAQAHRSVTTDALSFSWLKNMSQRDLMDHLHDSIRACIESLDSKDYCHRVEEVFLAAKTRLSDADFCTTVIGAFLASKNKPSPQYSYALVCRDPLALLKCPMRVWRYRELRRIVVSALSSILETNTAITINTSPLEDSAEELLAARNVLVVRCLLVTTSGGSHEVSSPNCCLTLSLIRSIVASQRGLVAMLVKQGLDESALDLFIDSVPETMNDSQDLIHLLSKQSALTAAEKLQAADAVIRIAVINGQSNESDSATMAYTALAVLIDSFFLVVGPVGVPVNALMSSDNSGLDVTQIARNAAFRILKSLLLVRGRRTKLRKDCGMALQRLAGLCKGESASTGVGGAVAGRRKALLKEIFDLVMRAANSMGSCSVGSSAVSA